MPDIAYHADKVDRGFDLIVDIFGADHIDTYPDVILGLKCLNKKTDHIKVVIHQFVTIKKRWGNCKNVHKKSQLYNSWSTKRWT